MKNLRIKEIFGNLFANKIKKYIKLKWDIWVSYSNQVSKYIKCIEYSKIRDISLKSKIFMIFKKFVIKKKELKRKGKLIKTLFLMKYFNKISRISQIYYSMKILVHL